MKLLCATQFYSPSIGGMQISNRLLVEGLASAGASIDLHVFAGEENTVECHGNIRRKNHSFRPKSVLGHFACANTVIREAKALRPDFVLLLDEGMVRAFGLLPFVKKDGVHFISINSGSTLTRGARHVRGRVNARLVRRGYRWLDLIFVAQSTADALPKACPEVADRARLLGRPVADRFFDDGKDESCVVNFKNDLPTFFSCARAEEEKGISLVISALAQLRDESGEEVANFVFAGDGPALSTWQKMALQLSLRQVRFVGKVQMEDLIPYYHSCFMCIFTAHGVIETFGRTWIEAFACGKPVISTTTDNLKNLIKNGSNGITVDPNINSIVDGIRQALKLCPADYLKMSQQARESARPYKQSVIVENLLGRLQELK